MPTSRKYCLNEKVIKPDNFGGAGKDYLITTASIHKIQADFQKYNLYTNSSFLNSNQFTVHKKNWLDKM
jgi:hypothetical protein